MQILRTVFLLCLPLFIKAEDNKSRMNIDFTTGSIGNRVWFDTNKDGLQTSGEEGAAGITVLLKDANGTVIANTSTNVNGEYLFSGINTDPTGKRYQVVFKIPNGFQFCMQTGLVSDSNNSDADQATGVTSFFDLLPGDMNTHVDAGIFSATAGTLPLHRLELVATLKNTLVTLNWFAENEMNTQQFIIERSFDGINFSPIGEKPVVGQTNTPTKYDFTNDIKLFLFYSIIYYRIKAEDPDRRYAYSNIITVRLNKNTNLNVWPNPFINKFLITYYGIANSKLHLSIADDKGRIVREREFEICRGINQLSIDDVGNLAPGLYFLSVTDINTRQSISGKIIK